MSRTPDLPSAPAPAPDPGTARREPAAEDWQRVRESAEFTGLRRRFRRFAFPMTAAFLLWYLLYVLLSTYAEDLMATPVLGRLNVGIVLGLGQFVTTFLLTWLYVRHADRNLDPAAAALRAELEGRA